MKKAFDVLITHEAEKDFQTIWEYIAQSNPSNASDFLEHIEEKIASLSSEPARCPIIPENQYFQDSIYRHLIYKDYRIVFSIREHTVYIMRIFHGAKLLDIAEFNR